MKNRLLICTLTLTLAGSVVAFAGTGAAAAKPSTTPAKASAVVAGREHTKKLSPATTAAAMAAVPTPTAADLTVIPHLDPALNAVAGVPGATPNSSVDVSSKNTVNVIAEGTNVAAAAQSVGAGVGADFYGSVALQVPVDKLQQLAATPGVSNIQSSASVATQAASGVISQGVAASGAEAWNSATPAVGNGGQGVNIAIVDAGFGQLASEEQAGNLDASKIVADPTPGTVTNPKPNMCGTANYNGIDHGTAVAEIAQQMAPAATLYLYCVSDSVSFYSAVSQILQFNVDHPSNPIKIASSSLDLGSEGRGDGYAGGKSSELAVRAAREHGVLWIQSAGNLAEDHWSGTMTDHWRYDANGNGIGGTDGWLDLYATRDGTGPVELTENDSTALEVGQSGYVQFSWDQWPTSNVVLQLVVQAYDYDSAGCSAGCPSGQRIVVTHQPGTPPSIGTDIANTTGGRLVYGVGVIYPGTKVNGTVVPLPAVRYDLTMGGEFAPDWLSGADPAKAAAGSISSPADSPWAFAVGAVYAGNTNGTDANGQPDGSNAGNIPVNGLEDFSSRGPTIDGRVKPDLVAYDGTSSNIEDVTSPQLIVNADGTTSEIPGTKGFYGTSAAAPHVAGAAALVLAANPSMDASQLEAFLESPANGTATFSPPNNVYGNGRLQLGTANSALVTPAAGSRYHALPPTQIVSTVTGAGVRKGRLGAGTELTVIAPSPVPVNATAIVVGLLGKAASGTTSLAVYPSVYDGTPTLSMSAAEPNATATSIVALNHDPLDASKPGTFKLRNNAAAVDSQIIVYGYFSAPSDSTGDGYTPVTPVRVVDTRSGTGAPKRKLAPNVQLSVNAGLPAGADVAVVNIIALNQTHAGFLSAFAASTLGPHSVDYNQTTHDNIVLVPLVNGRFTMVNRVGTTDASVDVVGYFSASGVNRYVPLPSRLRLVATPSGTGGRYNQMIAGSVLAVDGGGVSQVPSSASALWLGVTVSAVKTGYLNVYPIGAAMPGTVALDYAAGTTVQNQALVRLSPVTSASLPGFAASTRTGQVSLYEDALGYFAPPAS